MKTETQWDPEFYNDKHSYVYRHAEDLITLLDPKKHERILDLGCGSGELTHRISGFTNNIIGIDKSLEMISNAKSKYKELEFVVADAANFEFEEKFDAIFSNAALHWVTDYSGAIRCMYNNLKPKGRIALEFGGKDNVQTIINQLRKSLAKRSYTQQSKLQLWYFPSVEEYTKELNKVGFKVVLAKYFDRPTELADEKSGIKDWISMFGESFFIDVKAAHIEEIKNEVQEMTKEKCFINSKWIADYKRIRIIAIKE